MAQQNVCDFFKYGFCKFKTACKKQHVMEKCVKSDCDIKSCRSRHPRVCRYYRDIGFCKFGEWCLFKHDRPSKSLNEVKEISVKINNIEKLIERKVFTLNHWKKILTNSRK